MGAWGVIGKWECGWFCTLTLERNRRSHLANSVILSGVEAIAGTKSKNLSGA